MPKRRSSAIAAVSGAAAAVSGETSSGEERSIAGSIFIVNAFSPTRGRMESLSVNFTSDREAIVRSGSGNAYQVTQGEDGSFRCTCPDFRFRGRLRPCRHIEGVRTVLRGERMLDTGAPAALPTERRGLDASRLAEEAARRREESAEAARRCREAAAQQLPEGSLSDDALFDELYQKAAAGDVSYEYEDVLGGSDVTFGVEIEFEGGDRQAIGRELYQRGLIPQSRQVSYHSPRHPGLWAFETDGSVSGGEIVSPVLRDTPETWRQIEEICEVIRRNGGRVTHKCGAHVHIGNTPIDHDRQSWRRLVRICRENEDLLYRIAAGGESRGQHRGTRYTRPLTRVSATTLRSGTTSEGHYDAVNVRSHTIEFRYFNGTLDPRQIQTNVRLSHAIVQAAARPETRLSGRDRPLGETRDAGSEDPGHTSVREFLDNIFTRTRDKLAGLWLYATSQWQPSTI